MGKKNKKNNIRAEKPIKPVKIREKANYGRIMANGLFAENPTFVQVLGMCPTLAVTTSAISALGMGVSTLIVLTLSNFFISLVRKVIPDQIRIACYIVLIAGFVTMIDMVLKAYFPDISKALGIFIPLIVVNCIILGRAEVFASKNRVLPSLFDGVFMGVGFTGALFLIGSIREVLGAGSFFGIPLFGAGFSPALIMILPAGAFIVFGLLLGMFSAIKIKREKKARRTA
ncbi:electron transport complex subunit RsxE [Treponema sp. R6D11]